MKSPSDVLTETFSSPGKNVYLVGGAVRDKLLGRPEKDRDWVLVGATPTDVEELMASGFTQVGADFPVFLHPTSGEEYALARVERKTGKGYHGFVVEADASVTIEDDLIRRDLTMNSMAMDEGGEIIDPHGGMHDVLNKILRHTSPAFAEDPLRVLRLARFAARTPDWTIYPATIELCREICAAKGLEELSVERIWVELEKGFEENVSRFMHVLQELGALKNCLVLSRLFGSHLSAMQVQVCKALQAIDRSHRFVTCVATLSLQVPSFACGASRQVQDCVDNLKHLVAMERTPEGALSVLKKARAFQEGDTFKDLRLAAAVLQGAGVDTAFSSRELETARRVAVDVRAMEFTLQGKALGAAIEAKRVEKLREAIEF